MNRSRANSSNEFDVWSSRPQAAYALYLYSKRPPAFFVCGGMSCADIAFDRDGVLDWRPPVFLQCRTIGLHEGRYLAEPAAVDDKPCIANPRSASHRDLGLGGDIERWSTRADGLQAQPSVIHCVKPALVGYSLLGPQAPHESVGFVEARHAFCKRDAECIELPLRVTQPHAENVITAD